MQLHWTLFITNFCLHQGIFPEEDCQGSGTLDTYHQITLQSCTLAIRKWEFPFCRTLSDLDGGTNTVTKKCPCEKWFVIIILTNTSSLTNKVGSIPVSYLYFLMGNSSVHVTSLSVNWDFDFNRYLWTVYLLRVLSFVMFPPYNFLLVLCFIILIVTFSDIQTSYDAVKSLLMRFFDAVKSLFPFVLASITFVVDIYHFCLLSIQFLFLWVMKHFSLVENSFYAFSEVDLPTLLSRRDGHRSDWSITGLYIPVLSDWFREATWPKLDQSVSSLRPYVVTGREKFTSHSEHGNLEIWVAFLLAQLCEPINALFKQF